MDLFYYLKLCIGLIEIWQKVLNIQGADDFCWSSECSKVVSSVFGFFDLWILLLSLSLPSCPSFLPPSVFNMEIDIPCALGEMLLRAQVSPA